MRGRGNIGRHCFHAADGRSRIGQMCFNFLHGSVICFFCQSFIAVNSLQQLCQFGLFRLAAQQNFAFSVLFKKKVYVQRITEPALIKFIKDNLSFGFITAGIGKIPACVFVFNQHNGYIIILGHDAYS